VPRPCRDEDEQALDPEKLLGAARELHVATVRRVEGAAVEA
jgi:hypothetical protein